MFLRYFQGLDDAAPGAVKWRHAVCAQEELIVISSGYNAFPNLVFFHRHLHPHPMTRKKPSPNLKVADLCPGQSYFYFVLIVIRK